MLLQVGNTDQQMFDRQLSYCLIGGSRFHSVFQIQKFCQFLPCKTSINEDFFKRKVTKIAEFFSNWREVTWGRES